MPIDPSIYSNQQPAQGFNTPFQALATISTLQQHRQNIANAQALEQERQQRMAEQQKKDAADQRFYAILQSPNFTVDNLLQQTAQSAPEHFGTAQKLVNDAAEAAAKVKASKAQADEANALFQLHQQQYMGGLANAVKKYGDTPEALQFALSVHQKAFPDSTQPELIRQQVMQAGPGSIAKLTSMLIAQSEQAQKSYDDSQAAAAELPGKTAKAQMEQQVAAGMVGGLTPEQQSQAKNRQAQLGLEQARLGLAQTEEQRKADEAAAKKAAGKTLPAASVKDLNDSDKALSDIQELRARLQGNTGTVASVESHLPNWFSNVTGIGQEAKATNADIILAKNIVGRLVHGGVLRASDVQQAGQYMPQIGDSNQVVNAKIDKIIQLGQETHANNLENFRKAGYDVSQFQKPAPTAAAAGGPKVGDTVMVGGKKIKISAIHPDGTFDGDPVQ
jgi:hypothetical protein